MSWPTVNCNFLQWRSLPIFTCRQCSYQQSNGACSLASPQHKPPKGPSWLATLCDIGKGLYSLGWPKIRFEGGLEKINVWWHLACIICIIEGVYHVTKSPSIMRLNLWIFFFKTENLFPYVSFLRPPSKRLGRQIIFIGLWYMHLHHTQSSWLHYPNAQGFFLISLQCARRFRLCNESVPYFTLPAQVRLKLFRVSSAEVTCQIWDLN